MVFDRFFHHPAFDENPFRFSSDDSILNERDLGIAGERATVLTQEFSACRISGLQNCPYTGTGFSLEVRICGERIPGREWTWLPNVIRRRGARGAWSAETVTMIPPQTGRELMLVSLTNRSDKTLDAPIQLIHGGSVRKETSWKFAIPASAGPHFAATEAHSDANGSVLTLIGTADDVEGNTDTAKTAAAHVTVSCSLSGLTYFANAEIWETTRTVAPGETLVFALAAELGSAKEPSKESVAPDWERDADAAFSWLAGETERIFDRLPRFSSSEPELDRLYVRSVVTYSLNRFLNPEFVTSPFYTTGSITGGCMCSYLWDYSGAMMLHPLIDPESNKKMIRAYLAADICTSFAITPLDGSPTGPWYHINQEKIIGMIYYHVLHTGEVEFLREKVAGKTVLEWAVFHAFVLDDPSRPVALADYGDAGKSHLELRRGYVYKGVMPDLNARRYQNYLRSYRLTCLAGTPDPRLLERAEALKPLLETLWDEDAGWYDFIWEGKRQKRYTVQMFKFLDSPVIDDERRGRLVAHLNDGEFLSRYGLHSMSKTDPAYDQVDIDNGGGGICVQFTMQIVQQLYDTGFDELATDILRRVLWWGSRLPYLGDSCAANMLMDREDTPLQSDISSASAAQMMLFGMCGIRVENDGFISISPPAHLPAQRIRVENVRLCGKVFTLSIADGRFCVETEGKRQTAELGKSIFV